MTVDGLRAARRPGACENLLRDHGEAGLAAFAAAYPGAASRHLRTSADRDGAAGGGRRPRHRARMERPGPRRRARRARGDRGARFTLLFHDTHHRAVSDPEAIRAFDLDGYDGVLAFGETLAAVYRALGLGRPRLRLARGRRHAPVPSAAGGLRGARAGLVWIGNWGDDERSAELETLPVPPRRRRSACRSTSTACAIPRRPCATLRALRRALSRLAAERRRAGPVRAPPRHRARAAALLRRAPARHPDDPGVRGAGLRHPPGLRALGRRENLFAPGEDFLVAARRAEMERHLRALAADAGAAAQRSPPAGSRRSGRATPARTAPTNCWPSPRGSGPDAPERAAWRSPHEDRLLRIEPAVLLLERRRHLLPRHAPRPRRAAATRSPSTSRTPSTGSSIATSTRPTGPRCVVYPATTEAAARRGGGGRRRPTWWSRRAASACSTTSCSTGVMRRRAPGRDPHLLGRRRAGDAGRAARRPEPSPAPGAARRSTSCSPMAAGRRWSPPTRASAPGAASRSTTRSIRRRIIPVPPEAALRRRPRLPRQPAAGPRGAGRDVLPRRRGAPAGSAPS